MSDLTSLEVGGNEDEKPTPTKLGPKEAFADFLQRMKDRAGIQVSELGVTPDMVKYREDNMQGYGDAKTIQADVVFEGTRFQQAFDRATETLLTFARNSDKSTGWKIGDNGESATWGKYGIIELPNGRRYEVIDENREGHPIDKAESTVSIRPDYSYYKQKAEAEGRDYYKGGKSYNEGAYYFQGGGHWTGRKIEICGARMPGGVDEVMKDIKDVVYLASKVVATSRGAK